MAGKKRKGKHNKNNPHRALNKKSGFKLLIEDGYRLTVDKQYNEIISLLEPHAESNLKAECEIDYYKLLGFAYCNTNRLLEAENMARSGNELALDDYDFHYLLAFIYTSFKDYENVIEYSEKYLDLLNVQKSNKTNLSRGCEHLVLNFQAISYKALGKLDEAENSFLKSIEIHPKNSHPYLNLATLYLSQAKPKRAEQIIIDGLQKCSQVQELRMMQKSMKRTATVSACMMVKNEEKLLPNCLESIRHWVDEIIVVDTGSTDKTVEIAKSYGAKVYHQEWQNDFSFHRNYSMSKATKDWIFIIDADEEFLSENMDELWQAVAHEEFRLVSINVFNMNRETGAYSSFLPSSRFIRRSSGIQYNGIVHNQLDIPNTERIPRTSVRINHYGYDLSPELMKKKLARSKTLLEKQIEENPEDSFAQFNMAQILRARPDKNDDIGHNEKIIYHAKKAVEFSNTEKSGSLAVHLQGHHQQITALINMKKYSEAEEICKKVLEIKPDYLDPILSLGHVYAAQFKLDEAEDCFNKYLKLHESYEPSKETLNIILLYINHRYIANYGIALIKQFQKKNDEALEYFHKTLKYVDSYQETFIRMSQIYLDNNDLDKAYKYLQKEQVANGETDNLCLNLARYHGLKGNKVKAGEYMDKAIELTDNNMEVLERGGVHYANSGKFNVAIELFTRLINLRPEYPHANRLLAKAYYDSGDFQSAAIYYEILAKLEPDNAETMNNLGGAYFKIEDYENAEIAYANALEIDDNIMLSYRNLGLTKMKLKKHNEALSLFDNYLSANQDDFGIVKVMGSISMSLNDFTTAISRFEAALKNNPDDSEALFYISECYFNLGYTDSAAVGYIKLLENNPEFEPARKRLEEIEIAKTV